MMQKIKYSVGSTIKNGDGEVKILDLSPNKEIACISFKTIHDGADGWLTQNQLDKMGFKLVSSPRWIPENGNDYYYIDDCGAKRKTDWRNDAIDIFRFKSDNVFKTYEERQKKIDEINSREI